MRRHQLSHLDDKTFPCDDCDKSFTCQEYLDTHVKKAHSGIPETEVKMVDCPDCGTTMPKKQLRRHMQTHENGEGLICDMCEKSFTSTELLTVHQRVHENEERVNCDDCGKVLGKNSIRRHIMVAHSEGDGYPCEVCGKSYKSIEYLNSHRRTHDEERVDCEQCGKTVAQSSMKRHLMTHNTSNKFPCDVCGKVFKCVEYLNSHAKNHVIPAAERYVVCTECGMSVSKKNLLRHMKRSHTKNEKTYKCDKCGKMYACYEYLKNHISR